MNINLNDLGITAEATSTPAQQPRAETRRRVLGLAEAEAAGVPADLIAATAWAAAQERFTTTRREFFPTSGPNKTAHVNIPLHVRLALTPTDGEPDLELLRNLVPDATLQRALKRAFLRLKHLHGRGVPADRIVEDTIKTPAVWESRWRRGEWTGDLPDEDCVWIP